MERNILPALLALTAALFVNAAVAAEYKPFDGMEGYQEIKVSEDTYYVAFHGSRQTPYKDVVMGWAARSAQLCSESGASHYVELAHALEPLTEEERARFLSSAAAPRVLPARGGSVYIPIFVPSGPRSVHVDAPSKLGAVRCIRRLETVIAKERLVSIADRLNEAAGAGMSVTSR